MSDTRNSSPKRLLLIFFKLQDNDGTFIVNCFTECYIEIKCVHGGVREGVKIHLSLIHEALDL